MKLTKDDQYNLVSDLLTRTDFESRISNYKKKYSDLLTDDVLALLIVDELGRNILNNREIEISDISSIDTDGPVNIIGTIAEKNQLRSFNRKNNSTGYVLNLKLYDGTGSIRITLWDEHAKAAEEYVIGDQIKIINGYSKLHNSVREIHSSYHSRLIRNNID